MAYLALHSEIAEFHRSPSWSEKRGSLGEGEVIASVHVLRLREGCTIRWLIDSEGNYRELIPSGFPEEEVPRVTRIIREEMGKRGLLSR